MKQTTTLALTAILAIVAVGITSTPAFAQTTAGTENTAIDKLYDQMDAAFVAVEKEFGISYPVLTDAQWESYDKKAQALDEKYGYDDYSEEAENAWIALDKEFGISHAELTDAQWESYDSKMSAVCDSFESKFDALGTIGAQEHDMICNFEGQYFEDEYFDENQYYSSEYSYEEYTPQNISSLQSQIDSLESQVSQLTALIETLLKSLK